MMTPVKKTCAIKPAEFYGSGLPRPRFLDNPHRVDPPLSVLDPLLSWAKDAHWSMGGLNFKRLRLQGRIEGSVDKLRHQLEKSTPLKPDSGRFQKKTNKRSGSESPPAAPVAVKRRRFLDLNDDDDDEEIGSEDEGFGRIRRKLSDDFDKVAVETKTKVVKAGKKSIDSETAAKETEKVTETSPKRTSPRLSKRRTT